MHSTYFGGTRERKRKTKMAQMPKAAQNCQTSGFFYLQKYALKLFKNGLFLLLLCLRMKF